MAARSRPRAGQLKEEIDEERTLWSQIRADAKRVDHLMAQSDAISKKIVDLTEQQTAAIARGDSPSSTIDADLEKSLRENIRLSEEIQNLIADESGNNDILKSLEILAALRDAHEPDPISTSRAASVGKSQRDRQTKRKHTDTLDRDERESIAAESPGPGAGISGIREGGGPSPKVMMNTTKDRLMKQAAGSRASSVPVGREGSVKVEDGEEGVKGHQEPPRPRLTPNTEVLYRPTPKSRSSSSLPSSIEGEGILCRVTSVIGEGKQRRYEIIDSDPDPPTPAQPYRASVNHLVPIPGAGMNQRLADLRTGKRVLALYPGTTTFYKAEVVQAWQKSGGGREREGSKDSSSVKGDGIKKEEAEPGAAGKGVGGKSMTPRPEDYVRLRFEGEDEADREMNVERRFVLPDR